MQKCCIIIPCYNESERILAAEFLTFVTENQNFTLLFVNDGSTDDTLNVLQKLSEQHAQINLLHLSKNVGKAEAVRNGVLHCKNLNYNYIGYWDADLSTPLSEILRFLTFFDGRIKFLMGSRLKRLGAVVKRTRYRHFTGRVFATFTSIILDLPVYDSQCGAKIFDASLIDKLFEQKFITKWLFDVELLARYQLLVGKSSVLSNVLEIPILEWKEVKGSKLNFMALTKVPFELMKINNYYKKQRVNNV
jgi:glycosyltransferase involved in cell wall biosynthesis